MAVRGSLLCAALIVLSAAGITAYRGSGGDGGCPAGLVAMNISPDASSADWTACTNWAGTAMVLTNIGTAVLLVSPQDGTSLRPVTPDEPAGGGGTPDDLAARALTAAGNLPEDLQAKGLTQGWRYLAPKQSALATGARRSPPAGSKSRSESAAAVTAVSDYEATARWLLARSIAGWAQGQNSGAGIQTVLTATWTCESALTLPATYRSDPPEIGNVIRAAVADAGCRSLLHTLAPVDDMATVAYDVSDMANQLARTLPSTEWSGLAEEALPIFRHQ